MNETTALLSVLRDLLHPNWYALRGADGSLLPSHYCGVGELFAALRRCRAHQLVVAEIVDAKEVRR